MGGSEGQDFAVKCLIIAQTCLVFKSPSAAKLPPYESAIITLGKHDDQVPGLLEELATLALPADWLVPGGFLRIQPSMGRGQREDQQSEDHMDPHGAFMFLRGMAPTPTAA